jgi:hypothetical protein
MMDEVRASSKEIIRQIRTAVIGANGESYINVSTEWIANLADFIEQQDRLARLGAAAEKAVESGDITCGPVIDSFRESNLMCQECEWLNFCRIRAEKEAT